MPDTFVQDILDPEELEKRNAWNKRLDLPVLVSLDEYFQKEETDSTLLSGEFVQKINPDNFRIEEGCMEPALIRYLGANEQTLTNINESMEDSGDSQIETAKHFYPAVSILVDGTGFRNDLPDNVLPTETFVINRKKYDDLELLATHIKMLIGIPFSHKGIGKRSKEQDFGFSKDHPFYIFVAAFDDVDLRQYMAEVKEIIEGLKEDLIKVVGFLAPKVG